MEQSGIGLQKKDNYASSVWLSCVVLQFKESLLKSLNLNPSVHTEAAALQKNTVNLHIVKQSVVSDVMHHLLVDRRKCIRKTGNLPYIQSFSVLL